MKKKSVANHPLDAVVMLVDWVDSVGDSGWLDREDCKAHLLICQTVGFLVEETEEIICLALNKTTREGYKPFGELISIPKVAIKGIKKLKM